MSATAVVTLFKKALPTMTSGNAGAESFKVVNETFRRSSNFGDWLGFYDWLRTAQGQVIGVRIRPDEKDVLTLFEPYISRAVVVENGVATIRTLLEGEVCELISNDADFGGNGVYFGSEGALALTFFWPREKRSL